MNQSLISPRYIFENIEVSSFNDLVYTISKPLISDKCVTDDFPQRVIDRENIFPTGLPTEPYGVAIPHTNPEYVLKNTISIATLKEPLKMNIMGGIEEETVDVSVIFLLALGESNKQLNILKQIMEIIRDDEILSNLKYGNKEQIFELVSNKIKL